MIRRHGLFLLSCLFAFTAGHMFNYTVILYLQESVGSDLLSGIGFGLAFGSSIVFGWYGGVLCDRLAPVRVIHGAQALFLLGLACIAWADQGAAPEVRPAWVLLGAFFGGLAWSFVGPARLTALAKMVSANELRPATIVFNLQVLLGFGLAPLLLGIIRSRAGWAMVLGAAAAAFVLSSLLLLPLKTQAQLQSSSNSVRTDIAQGFAVVGANQLLRQLMLAAVVAFAMTGPLQILLPKLARTQLGLSESARGAYLGLLAISLILGGVAALVLSRWLHHGRAIFGGVIVGSALFATLAAIEQPVLSAFVLCAVGVLGGMVISLVISGIQTQTPEHLRGRVMAMYSITSQVVPALSGVVAGAVVSRVNIVGSIALCGSVLCGVALFAAWRLSALRCHAAA